MGAVEGRRLDQRSARPEDMAVVDAGLDGEDVREGQVPPHPLIVDIGRQMIRDVALLLGQLFGERRDGSVAAGIALLHRLAGLGEAAEIRHQRPTEDGPRHFLVGRAGTSISPEGIAISPDGEWAVTTNLEVSYAPADDARHTPYSSLTLIDIDPQTGRLETVGTYAYDGILPEAAVWDASSSVVAVVTFDQLDPGAPGGSIDFWRLVAGPEPSLVKLRASIQTPHGPHSIVRSN